MLVVDLNALQKAVDYLMLIENHPIDDVRFMKDGKSVEVSKDTIDYYLCLRDAQNQKSSISDFASYCGLI